MNIRLISIFYLKLVLKHLDLEIDKTWMKGNMEFGLYDPSNEEDSPLVQNVIVRRKYKSRNLYEVNPLIVNDGMHEYQYENFEYVNSYYNKEYGDFKGIPVLTSDKEVKLLILKDIFEYYINDPEDCHYPKYELVAEFEFRTHKADFSNIEDGIYKDDDYYIKIDKNNQSTYVLGSIKIPFIRIENEIREIKVIDLLSGRVRKHNPNNYTGDTNEGLIYFKKDIIKKLREKYYFYGLEIIDKSNIDNSYIIDVLEDKIMFFEGEYNKLPSEVKDVIDRYNCIPDKNEENISEAMNEWQLQANWNWEDKLMPNAKLARLIQEKHFSKAMELGMSFEEPENKIEFGKFIGNIEIITGVKLENFNTKSNEVKEIIKIRDNKDIEVKDLKLYFQKYCYAIWRKCNE